MNIRVLQELVAWRKERALREGVDLFRILPNRALEDIARDMPHTKTELTSIKGIKERKYFQYGKEILALVEKHTQREIIETKENISTKEEEASVVSEVGAFLDRVNRALSSCQARIRGEVSSVQHRGRAVYFTIKDRKESATLPCFMWENDRMLSGIQLEEGMEIIVSGFPDVYKPMGKISFRSTTLELVGEGALKAAYEKLKSTLEEEGLMRDDRKRALGDFPRRIGIITSRDGAVIHDFLNNVGKYGFQFFFQDTRVEGQMAVRDLMQAVRNMKSRDLDALVIMRGGGSLESLQAFNNEALIREIVDAPFPVIAAIGHHKDIPLLSLVADITVSTPTAGAQILNTQWEAIQQRLYEIQNTFLYYSTQQIMHSRKKIDAMSSQIEREGARITERFSRIERIFESYVIMMRENIRQKSLFLEHVPEKLFEQQQLAIGSLKKRFEFWQRSLLAHDPHRALQLGYALIRFQGSIVRSVQEISEGDKLEITVCDGIIQVQCKAKTYDKKE